MKRYVLWTEADIQGLSKTKGILRLFTEINETGIVVREVGLNVTDKIVHRFPSIEDERGIFDLARVNLSSKADDFSSDEFERLWIKAINSK